MRFILAPDSFKENMTALEAAEAMRLGVRDVHPDADCVLVPMSDGGEGFIDAVATAWGADRVEIESVDALDPASQTWEFMPETRILDEASFQARWNDKGVVVRVRAEDVDVQATDAVKLTTADGSFRIPRSGGEVDGRPGSGSRHARCRCGTARARRIRRPRCSEAGCEGSGFSRARLNALSF